MIEPAETSEILAFAKTVEVKSLSRAALELGVPRATIGRRLARLEERLDVRLLRRTTRSLVLTDAGEAFYRHARIVLDAVASAEQSVRRADDDVRGALRISLPPMGDPSLAAMLIDFAAKYPLVQVHAHFSTRLVDLQRDGFDVALRASTEFEPGLVARTLLRDSFVAVASPAYLKARGTPRSARDLKKHACLLGFARGEVPQTHWPLLSGKKLRVEGVFASNAVDLLTNAAVAGLGVAMLPNILAGKHFASGALVHVLPGIVGTESRVAVVYLDREFVPPQVRAFVDAVSAWAKANLGRASEALRETKRAAKSRR